MTEGIRNFLGFCDGTGDLIKDAFGHEIPICDLRKGFNSLARFAVLASRISATSYVALAAKTGGVPKYTEIGFEKRKVPESLFKLIKRKHSESGWIPEDCELMPGILSGCFKFTDNGEECGMEKQSPTFMLAIGTHLEKKIGLAMKHLAEEWSSVRLIGGQLKIGKVYGVRRYTRGGYLTSHVDRPGK